MAVNLKVGIAAKIEVRSTLSGRVTFSISTLMLQRLAQLVLKISRLA